MDALEYALRVREARFELKQRAPGTTVGAAVGRRDQRWRDPTPSDRTFDAYNSRLMSRNDFGGTDGDLYDASRRWDEHQARTRPRRRKIAGERAPRFEPYVDWRGPTGDLDPRSHDKFFGRR